ncbi:MAG: hypothetical protein CMJ35_15230 [Phycisphaerae bacterium]|nr:hypothetical protein [Phycisphaerae bacterium]MBM92942.1 hypothetical protein [Phycisphaerae bacterium]HCT46298.1 hypothetical protein [Phycisphaerales bacterium]
MINTTNTTIESRWARLGVLFNAEPSPESPDIERLILDTARELPSNPRLFPLVITWLVEHGFFVARHRLKHLVTTELEPEHQPVLGLLLDEAIAHGAPAELRIVRDVCTPFTISRPLFDAYRDPSLADIAKSSASESSKWWGIWAPPVELKRDAVRPSRWILEHNPHAFDRIVRRGDLRASILETLRIDLSGVVPSVAKLSRVIGATRVAVRAAIESLSQEGAIVAQSHQGSTKEREIGLAA